MGVVFKAEDRYVVNGRVLGPTFVAVKVVNTAKDLGDEAIQAIKQEGERLRDMRDDNIVAMKEVEFDAEANTWFLIMELLEGEPLDLIIKRYPNGVPHSDGMSLIEQLCNGVKYLHERVPVIVHSDLKPSNVFVTRNQQLKILDFGISDKVRSIGEPATLFDPKRWGALCPPYACLELWSGTAPDPRDDVYSVGCIAYELLAGKHPFDGASARDRAQPGARFEIAPIASLKRRQNAVLRRALALHRADRIPTIGQFLAAFNSRRRYGSGSRSESGEPRPNWRFLLPVGLGLIMIAGALAWRSLAPKTAKAPQTRGATLTLHRIPASATVFIDDNEVDDAIVGLSAGDHELAAVAPGYYGSIQHMRVDGAFASRSLSFTLDSTTLPPAAELERFSKLVDSKAPSEKDMQSLSDRTFRNVLDAMVFKQSQNTVEFSSLIRDIDTLRRLGDSRAAVAAFLLDSAEAGHIARSQVTQSLIAASDGGDAMASLFLAVSYRESLNTSDSAASPSDPMFDRYCQRLRQAAKQGWEDVARDYLQRDHCFSRRKNASE